VAAGVVGLTTEGGRKGPAEGGVGVTRDATIQPQGIKTFMMIVLIGAFLLFMMNNNCADWLSLYL
jgi:hypothetical protein